MPKHTVKGLTATSSATRLSWQML